MIWHTPTEGDTVIFPHFTDQDVNDVTIICDMQNDNWGIAFYHGKMSFRADLPPAATLDQIKPIPDMGLTWVLGIMHFEDGKPNTEELSNFYWDVIEARQRGDIV